MYLDLVSNKSAYISLLYIDIILFVKTIFDFKQVFYPDNQLSGQPGIRRMKPDIRPDSWYKKADIRYNPTDVDVLFPHNVLS